MNGGIEIYDEWGNLYVLINDWEGLLFLVVFILFWFWGIGILRLYTFLVQFMFMMLKYLNVLKFD